MRIYRVTSKGEAERAYLSSEVPEADAILAYTRLVHGPSFFRAFASPEAMEEELGLAEVTLEFRVQ